MMPEIMRAYAERMRRSVKPDGGRQEGLATALPENLMMRLLTTPQRAFGAVHQYETEGTYNPAPIMEAAMLATTGAMPMAQSGALGSAGARPLSELDQLQIRARQIVYDRSLAKKNGQLLEGETWAPNAELAKIRARIRELQTK